MRMYKYYGLQALMAGPEQVDNFTWLSTDQAEQKLRKQYGTAEAKRLINNLERGESDAVSCDGGAIVRPT